jgi:hypothetical protein
MKTKKMLFWGVSAAVAALISLVSCGPNPSVFTLATTNVEVAPGEEFELTTVNATGDITWTINNEDGSFKASPNAGSTAMTIVGVKAGSGSIKAVCGGVESTCFVVVTASEKEAAPELLLPGAGLVRIAVRVPASKTCNGIRGVGTFNSWNPNDATQAFTPCEGTESWYQLDVAYDADLNVKVVSVNEAGVSKWDTQWGMNTDAKENVTFVGDASSELVTIELEYGGEVKLKDFADASVGGYVIYLDVDAWKSDPCTPKNPAGTASFTLTLTGDNAANVTAVAITGINGDWSIPGLIEMTPGEEANTFVATAEVPEASVYKYQYSFDGETYEWEAGDNHEVPVSLIAEDTLEPTLPVVPEE